MNTDSFVKGFKDVMSGAKPAISDEESAGGIQERDDCKETGRHEEAGRGEQEAGRGLPQREQKKEGVRTLESGLQYKVLKEGSGKKPTLYDK